MTAAFVQALFGHDETGSNVTSLSTNAGTAFTAGQYVVGSFLYLGNVTPVQSDILYITDGTHTYPIIDYISNAGGCGVVAFYGPATAGATTITVKLAGAGEPYTRLMCHVVSGVSGQIDGHTQSYAANISSTTMTTPSLTTTAAGDYIYTYILNDFNSWGTATVSSPFTEENHFNTAGAGTEVAVDAYDVQGSAGSISATFVGTATGSGVDVTYGIIALKAGAAQKVIALTSANTSPWTPPADYPGTADAVYVIGAGGNGSVRVSSTRGGSGGGGGACVYAFNYATSGNPTFSIGATGSAANTTFDSSAFIAAHGTTGTTTTAGAGGTTASSTVPTGGTKVAGGAGVLPPTSNAFGGGGGGAAGPDGAGGNASTDIGGTGDNGATAAPAVGVSGIAGTQWTATAGGNFGPGSGGSGFASGTHTGTTGGLYGGGASGASDGSTSAGGSGGGGLVIIIYTPQPIAQVAGWSASLEYISYQNKNVTHQLESISYQNKNVTHQLEFLAGYKSGFLPPGIPTHFALGLQDSYSSTWMPSSGIPWDYRYAYLSGAGWKSFNYPNGQFASLYVQQSIVNNYIPTFTWYEAGGQNSGSAVLTWIQSTTNMATYYADFVLALQKAVDWFGWLTVNASAARLSLSNDNSVVTFTGTSNPDEMVVGGVFHSTGKWIYTLTINTNGGSIEVGLAQASSVSQSFNYLGYDTTSAGLGSGGLLINNTNVTTIPTTLTSGSVVDVAVDFDNKLIWSRTNGGNWNGNATFAPGGTGGMSLSTLAAGAYAIGASLKTLNDQITIGTPATIAGFSPWYSGLASSPIIMHIEPDMWGYMQQQGGPSFSQTDDPTQVAVSVASSSYSGPAGFSSLPNNARGFAQALKLLRDTYAPGVLLAFSVSRWAKNNGYDPTTSTTLLGQQTASYISTFYAGLQTAFDITFHEVSDRDSAYTPANAPTNNWWTATYFENFRQFMLSFYQNTDLVSILWQVPIGNTLFQACNNTAYHYQDDRVEFFLPPPSGVSGFTVSPLYSSSNISNFIATGMIGILFGPGQSTDTDNGYLSGSTLTGGGYNPGALGTAGNPVNGNSNSAVATVSDDDGGFLRLAAAKYYTTPIALLNGVDLGINSKLPIEWLLVTGTPLTQDDNLPLEWMSSYQKNIVLSNEAIVSQLITSTIPNELTLSQFGNYNNLFEYLSSQRSDINDQLEWISSQKEDIRGDLLEWVSGQSESENSPFEWVAAQIQEDSKGTFESISGQVESVGNRLDWISSQRTDISSLLDLVASLSQKDASALYETTSAQIASGNYLNEWLGTTITSQTQNDNLPFEWICSQIINANSLSEWASSQFVQTKSPAEFTSTIAREDNSVLSEWLSRQIINGNLPDEWLGTIITNQTEDNNLPLEWISSQAVGSRNLTEWLSSQREDLNKPFGWLMALRQEDALIPGGWLSAQYRDQTVLDGWMSAGSVVNIYPLLEALSNGRIDYALSSEALFRNLLNYNILQEITASQQPANVLLAEWAGALAVVSNINVLLEMALSGKIDIGLLSDYISTSKSDNILSFESLYSSSSNYNLLSDILKSQPSDSSLPAYWLGAIGVIENINLLFELTSNLASSNSLPLGFTSSGISGIIIPSESLVRIINDIKLPFGYLSRALREAALPSDAISSGTSSVYFQKEWLLRGAANFNSPKEFLSSVSINGAVPIEWQMFVGAHLRSDQTLLFELLAANAIYVVSSDNLPFEWAALPKAGPGQVILVRPSGPLRTDSDDVLRTGGPRVIVVPGDLLPKKG